MPKAVADSTKKIASKEITSSPREFEEGIMVSGLKLLNERLEFF